MNAFRDLIINIGGGCFCKPVWTFTEGKDEPIIHMTYTLTSPVKKGFRRMLTITPDAPVDVLAGGGYAVAEVLQGSPTQFLIDSSSTATAIKAWAYGDGDVGDKVARVRCDGHVGEGVVDVLIDINWTVAQPDATTLTVTEGADEPIPA